MPAVRKITRTKFVFAESKTEAKLTPASLEKAKRYNISDVFEVDVLNSPRKNPRYARSGTPHPGKKWLRPRN